MLIITEKEENVSLESHGARRAKQSELIHSLTDYTTKFVLRVVGP